MELTVLKNNIVKLKSEEVYKSLEKWSFLNKKEIKELQDDIRSKSKMSKRTLAVEIAAVCNDKDGLTMDKVGELELICLQMHSTKRQWSAYHLSEKQGSASVTDSIKSPSKLRLQLIKQIKNYFHKGCSVSVVLHEGLLWGRLYLPLPKKKSYQPTRCLYFIYYPHSPIIILSGMKVGFAEYISQCFVVAFGYKELTELSLTGHHYPSLAELAMDKFSEGGYTKYQQTHRLGGPLSDITSRKRKAPAMFEHENIIDTNRGEKRRRLEILDENFSENVQPTLEKLEYRVELPYRCKEVAPDLKNDGNLFHSRVRFRGTSVLEGLRNLAAASYATVPLPKHLTCVPSRARNTFLLGKQPKTVTSSQNETQNQSRQK